MTSQGNPSAPASSSSPLPATTSTSAADATRIISSSDYDNNDDNTTTTEKGISSSSSALPGASSTVPPTAATAASAATSSGTGAGAAAPSSSTQSPTPAEPLTRPSKDAATTTTGMPAASTSTPAPAPASGSQQTRKKRKAGGGGGFLSNFFANLCGGGGGGAAKTFEDDKRPSSVSGRKAQAASAATTKQKVPPARTSSLRKPAGTPAAATDVESSESNKEMADRGATATNGTTTRPVQEVSTADAALVGGAAGVAAATTTIGGLVLGKELAAGGAASPLSDVAAGVDKNAAVVVAPATVGVTPPVDETEGMLSSAVQPPGSGSELLHTSSSHHALQTSTQTGDSTEISTDFLTDTSDVETGTGQQRQAGGAAESAAYANYLLQEEQEQDDEDRLIEQGGIGIPIGLDGKPAPLLPALAPEHTGRKCLVLDLDETLLHSSFKMIPSADYIVPVEIESQVHNVYVIKRPGVDNFLRKMGEIYEVVVFTASLSKYADPVLDMLDVHRVVKHRLFRESCYNHKGNYVKDLSQLGREMHTTIIIDNSPASYIFHPNNAVPVSTWFNDPHDTELTDLCPFLTDLETVDDVRGVLDGSL